MSQLDQDEPLASRIEALPTLPLRIGTLKNSAAGYLEQYQRHQHRAVSRGLLPEHKFKTEENRHGQNILRTEHQDSDEMLSNRLQYTRQQSMETLSQLENQLVRLIDNLMAHRKPVWVKSGIFGILASAILSLFLKGSQYLQPSRARFVPAFLTHIIPLLPFPIAAFFVLSHEHRISSTKAARNKVFDLIRAVEALESVSTVDVEWIASDSWDGVNWAIIEL